MAEGDRDSVTNVVVSGKSGAGKQPRIDVLVEEFDLEQLSTGNIFRSYLKKANSVDFSGELQQLWDDAEEAFVSDDKIAEMVGTDDEDVILGFKAKFFVDQGRFVPDYITNALFASYFEKRGYQGQVLDGYPRTVDQARFLLDLVDKHDSRIDFVVWVENSDERIIARTTKRRICPECGKVYHLTYKPPKEGGLCECGARVIQRSDDTEEKIRSRLHEFKEKTLPALEYLQEQDIPVVRVPGHLEEFTKENVRRSVMSQVEKLYE